MKTLHLNLKSKWFEMILKGDKTEEYRKVKPFWIDRLTEKPEEYPAFTEFKEFDTITFSNGYATERPQFEVELKGIDIREGNLEWGAEPGKKYFVLKLGEILNDINCAKFYAKILNL